MNDPSLLAKTALEMRVAFDEAYALPPASFAPEHTESLLSIGVAGHPYAIRIGEINGLASDRKVIPFPSPIRELVGLAAIRGTLVAVYSLAALLGYSRDAICSGWLVLCGKDELVGLTVSDFAGYLKVPADQVYATSKDLSVREHIRDAVRTADVTRMIVNIPSILETIQRGCGDSRVSKER